MEVQATRPVEPAAVAELFKHLKTGGFPKPINRHPDASTALLDGVISEAYRHGRSPQLLKDLAALLERVPSQVSHHALAQEVAYPTTRREAKFTRGPGLSQKVQGLRPCVDQNTPEAEEAGCRLRRGSTDGGGVAFDDKAVLTQYIGDLDSFDTLQDLDRAVVSRDV